MEYPHNVKGYELLNADKVRRVIEGDPTRDGNKGGIMKADGKWDDDELLARYDRLGGAISFNGDKVQTGSFWDFRNKKAKEKPEVMLEFRINGQLTVVPAEEEAPAIVKAARLVAKEAKEAVTKKKK